MKIALDLRRIKNPGIGRYMKCLTEALLSVAPQHQYLLILPADGADAVNVPADGTAKILTGLPYYSVQEQFALPSILRRHKVDVLHSPHFNVPLFSPCSCVVTIHDVIYLACREDLPSQLGRVYYASMMRAAVRKAKKIITDSEFSRREIRRFVKRDCEPAVIYPGVDTHFAPVSDPQRIAEVRRRYGIRGDYILYTGIYRPRKNHAMLLQAFSYVVQKGIQANLVVAGPLQEGETELRRLAVHLGLADRVTFTGFVQDEDLPALYSGAQRYACPSLYEGFGQTVLEAMACGVPVVCSQESSLAEVGGAAAEYADAHNPVEFGEALSRVFSHEQLRAELTNKGVANIARFSWNRAARDVLCVYEQAVGIVGERANGAPRCEAQLSPVKQKGNYR